MSEGSIALRTELSRSLWVPAGVLWALDLFYKCKEQLWKSSKRWHIEESQQRVGVKQGNLRRSPVFLQRVSAAAGCSQLLMGVSGGTISLHTGADIYLCVTVPLHHAGRHSHQDEANPSLPSLTSAPLPGQLVRTNELGLGREGLTEVEICG